MMHGLHTFLLFLLLACLGQNTLGSEIINGKKVPENLMLYMASIQNSSGVHKCGGFLVREDFVVTAAHCDHKNLTRIVLGTHDLRKTGGTVRSIVKKCKHPSYEKVANGNDIMLLKLSRVQLGKSIQPIQLPISEINLEEKNHTCCVAGWGKMETHGHSVDELREVDVSIINLQVCKKTWRGLPANVICAGGYGTNKGFCQGDSGGPLVCNGTAVGVVSFNMKNNCTYPNVPNVYTDISKYLPWINKVLTEKNC